MTEKSPSHNYFDKQTNINQVKQLLIPNPGDGGGGGRRENMETWENVFFLT